jgi:hypothetical protein
MADDCCNSFGGRISITIDGVRYAPTEADITLDISNLEISAQTNQDGSPAFTAKPKLFAAEVAFRKPCGIKWNDKMRLCKIDATIEEIDNNRTHLFTGARFTGAPRLNLASGAIEGVKIEGPRYQELDS